MTRRRVSSPVTGALVVAALAATPASAARLLASLLPVAAPQAAVYTAAAAAPKTSFAPGPLAAAVALEKKTAALLEAEIAWTVPAPAPAPATGVLTPATTAAVPVRLAPPQVFGTDSSSEHVAAPAASPVVTTAPMRLAAGPMSVSPGPLAAAEALEARTAALLTQEEEWQVPAPAPSPPSTTPPSVASVMPSWARYPFGSAQTATTAATAAASPPPLLPTAAPATLPATPLAAPASVLPTAPTEAAPSPVAATAPASATGLKSLEFMSSMEGGIANPVHAITLGASSVASTGYAAASAPASAPAAQPTVTAAAAVASAPAPADAPLPNLIPFTPPLPAQYTSPGAFGFVRLTLFSPPPGAPPVWARASTWAKATPAATDGTWGTGQIKPVTTPPSPKSVWF